MSNELATKLQVLLSDLPTDRVIQWVQLCKLKSTTIKELEAKELELQSLLIGYDKKEIVALQEALALYKKGVDEVMPEMRKGFTKYLDAIKKDAMVTEGRAAGWETYGLASNHLIALKLRKEEADKAKKNKDAELDQFRAHVKNQWARIMAQYTIDLNNTVSKSYEMALGDPAEMTEDGIRQYVSTAEAALVGVSRLAPIKFDFKLHTKEELEAAATTILPRPDYARVLAAAKLALTEKFKLYWQDRANAESAKANLAEETRRANAATAKESEQTQAVNTLVADSGATQITLGDGVKPLNRKTKIVVVDDNPEWAKKIVAAFLANWGTAFAFVSVKKYGNLSIAQMAAALDGAAIRVDGVEYKEEIK